MPKGIPVPRMKNGRTRRKNPGRPTAVIARQREAKVLELRLGGFTYEEIGAKIGISGVAAYNIVMRVLDQQLKDTIEKVPQARAIELNRCDTYLKAMLPKCKRGDIGAITTALKVAERRARLAGLDSAIKVDPLSGEGGAMAVELFRKMLDDANATAIKATELDEEEKS